METLDTYISGGGYRLTSDGTTVDVLDVLKDRPANQSLRGRGGAAFPTLQKINSVNECAQAAGVTPTVLCNGAESEPLSYKDRHLMRHRPHLVLDGALLAAGAVSAGQVYVYVGDDASHTAMRLAVDELNARRRGGPELVLVKAQDTYVAGEESAAIRAVETGVARPTDKPPRPYSHGIGGNPTLVLNVETLARLAHSQLPGTNTADDRFLATISGADLAPRIYELPVGLPLQTLAARLELPADGGGYNVLVGGFFGGLMPADPGLNLSYAMLRAQGNGLGCGALHFIAPQDCVVSVAADVAMFFSEYNARQCRSCISSTQAVADTLVKLAVPGRSTAADLEKLIRWSNQLPGRGACAVPDGLVVLLQTLVRHYQADLQDHVHSGCRRCRDAAVDRRWSRLSVTGHDLDGRYPRRQLVFQGAF
ncbi:NADH-ubiquinone oxidoreductase-F iron-sulfur binding region domain-containing protein [Mycolicibacterium sp.]|uniref:NADH-ubiquinone oxidoreductase-F iron-sulfur binding region domain-containing protein n=1 Tax=Mycolicibacterium sp. TaxID=2320850 RepID=UPI003D1434AA